ncbi:aminotransferase [Aurantiacibacter rhizosphaerae]|uniref:Aminotransferase n=1 Tax=Aurantiacibacter rhizosphaerae TaxID=2691582 RepID=A0A844XCY5_9SPHN|nr:aminotransferase [Aurantiacibacter rhizosphaerae]MWV27552.1 aminotransferase [Aurantiacibacter rhizosphaerae]
MDGTSKSDSWRADRDHFIHPYTDFTTFAETGSQVMSHGDAMMITDEDGRSYLDGIAGLWCVNLGHGRREIASAMGEQAARLGYFNTFGHSTNTPAALLARKLAERTPGDLNHVFFTTGGSTANDTAVRLAHYYFNRLGKPAKKKILSRHNGYHGSTYFAAALTGIHGIHYGFDRIAEDIVHHLSAADCFRRPDGMDEAQFCDFLVDEARYRIMQLGAENIAAFIAEPVMGAGGVLVAPEGYHRRMADLCRENDILYIADEVVTGFGRLGHWFASEDRFAHVPDILITAKGISSGYCPIGAAIFSDRIHEVISVPQGPGGVLTHGFTYSGHPVSCAAALKSIELYEQEDVFANVLDTGPYLQERLQGLTRHEIVGDVRGEQLMAGVELVANRASKTSFAPELAAAEIVFGRARELGVIVRPVGNTVIMSPPLIISREQVDKLVDALDQAIEDVSGQLLSQAAAA